MEETVPKRLPSTSESENGQTQSCSDTLCSGTESFSDTEAEAETETETEVKCRSEIEAKTQRSEQIDAKVIVCRTKSASYSSPSFLSFLLFLGSW